MGTIAKDNRKISIYYNSGSPLGKQTLAYVNASSKKILAIDISKTRVTETQWAEIADGLGVAISNLVNTKHPAFVKYYGEKHRDMDKNDWLKLMHYHPEIVTNPIVINGRKFILIENASDFSKYLDQESS